MRRRPSGSTSNDEEDSLRSDESQASLSDDASDTSRTHHAPILHRSDSKARRKRPAKAAWQADLPPKVAMLELRQSVTDTMVEAIHNRHRRSRLRAPWSFSVLMFIILFAAVAFMLAVWRSFTMRQLDPKGGSMSYMASAFVRFPDFDTEHTPFATKYNLYLYREMGLDEDPRVRISVLRHSLQSLT